MSKPMSATEFLRSVTAREIREASDASDAAEDAALGRTMEPVEFLERMTDRLARDYPGLHERIVELLEGMKTKNEDKIFLTGILSGAIMFAHDLTLTAEVHDARRMFDDPTAT